MTSNMTHTHTNLWDGAYEKSTISIPLTDLMSWLCKVDWMWQRQCRNLSTLAWPSPVHYCQIWTGVRLPGVYGESQNYTQLMHWNFLQRAKSSPAQENVEVLKAMVPHASATSASNRQQLPRATAANSNSALANRGDILIAVGPEAPLSIQINCHLSSNWSLRM